MRLEDKSLQMLMQKIKALDQEKRLLLFKEVGLKGLADNDLYVLHEIKNNVQLISGFFTLFKISLNDERKRDSYIKVLDNYIEEIKLLLSIQFENELSLVLQEVNSKKLKVELREAFQHLYPHVNFRFQSEDFNFYADKFKFKRILYNLLKNASESTLRKDLVIDLLMYRDKDSCYFIVSDNGDGIPQELQKQIFDSFITSKQEGFGIGLKLSKVLTDLHRGNLTCINSSSQGTTFELRLPTSLE